MHASRQPTVTLALAALLVAGCRGSLPLNNMVQVTGDPSVNLPDIEPPAQRLATAQPRVGAIGTKPAAGRDNLDDTPRKTPVSTASQSSRTSDRRPIADTVATATAEPKSKTAVAPKVQDQHASVASDQIETTVADAEMDAIKDSLTTNQGSPTEAKRTEVPQVKAPPEADASDTLADASLPADADRAALVDAFSSSSPEVQQQALRKLLALTTRNAERTAQPAAIDQLLLQALANPPKLPDANDTPAGTPPSRIAAATESVASSLSKRSQSEHSPATASISDSSTTQPTVVKAISSGSSDADDVVTTAAAASDSADAAVSQASHVSTADAPLTIASSDPESSAAPADSSQLSNQALFKLLLQRMGQPVPGETAADRSRREIMARHLMVLAGKPDQAVTKIEGFSEEEQEYLRHQLLGLWTIIDPEGHPVASRRFSSALPELREATKYLAASTDSLDVRSLAFCTKVVWYGQIKEFNDNRFKPGQQVLLYCEIDNFTVNRSSEGYETHLQGSYNIYDAENNKVFSQVLPADKQVSRNYMRDYFIAYLMYLPQQLTPGKYRLELTMEDVGGKKYGQSNLAFEIQK